MAPTKLKRSPDAAVSMAVAQVVKQQKSKRMMMFGLRNLSELCSPDKIKFKENSIAAMTQGVVPVLSSSIASYGDDEDVVLCSIKILKGISDYLIEEQDMELLDQFKEDGGVEAGLRVLTGCPGADEQALLTAIDFILNLDKLGCSPETSTLTKGLLQALSVAKSTELVYRIFKALTQICDQPDAVRFLVEASAWEPIFNVMTHLSPNSGEAVTSAEMGLSVAQKMVRVGKPPTSVMDSVMKTLDLFKGKKNVIDRGSAILALLLSPDELKKCLNALATAPQGSEERHLALTMLTSMSYISSYADAVVQAGAIPLLCNAIQTSSKELKADTPDPLLVKGLNGACKMLGRIAKNRSNIDAIVEADGLPALTGALETVQGIPASASTCIEALTPLLCRESNAQDFYLLEGYDKVVKILKRQLANSDVATAGIGLLATALKHQALTGPLYDAKMIDLINLVFKYNRTDSAYQMNAIFCLKQLSKNAGSYTEVESGHKELITLIYEEAAEKPALAEATLELLHSLLDIPGALPPFQKGDTADAVLHVMLAHPDEVNVQFVGTQILDLIATERDVKRCLDDLDRCIHGATTQAAKAYRALASVNGLSQIPRLAGIFEEKNASRTIQNGISVWIQSASFPDQQKVIRAAALSIESLQMNSTESADTTIIALLTTSLLPQLRSLTERQDVNDSNLLDLVRCCRRLCTSSQRKTRIPDNRLGDVVEAVTNVSWKYQDLRKVQVLCIEMLEEIAGMGNGVGARLLVDSGVVKNVVSYMSTVVIYEDVQVSGLRLLASCLQNDPNLVEPLKFAGAIDVCKSIQSHHASSPQIKALLPVVAGALMPSDFLDQDMKDTIDAIRQSLLEENPEATLASMETLLTLVSTPEGAKSAVTLRIGVLLQHIAASCATDDTSATAVGISILLSQLMNQLCGTRAGVNHLNRYGGQPILLNCLTILTNPQLSDTPEKKKGIEENLQAFRNLARGIQGPGGPGGTAGSTVDLKKLERQVPLFAKLVDQHPGETGIGGASAAVLAALPTHILASSPEVASLLKGFQVKLKTGDEHVRAAAAKAIAQLLSTDDDGRFKLVEQAGLVSALFRALDAYEHHDEVRTAVLQALLRCSRDKAFCNSFKEDPLEGNGRIDAINTLYHTVKEHCSNDPASAEAALRVLNALTTAADQKLLSDLGMVELASNLMAKYPDQKMLVQTLGELLGKAGAAEAVEQLMGQVILTATTKPDDGWRRSLELLCVRLAALIPSEVTQVQHTFARTIEATDALATVIKEEKDDPALVEAATLLVRRLIDRFEHTEHKQYGTGAVGRKGVDAVSAVLSTPEAKAGQNKGTLMNGYRILAACARDEGTPQDAVVDAAQSSALVELSLNRLKEFESDPQLVLRILEYLDALASCPKGLNVVREQQRNFGLQQLKRTGSTEGNECQQTVNALLGLLKRHRKEGLLVSTGVSLINALVVNDTALLPRVLVDLAHIAEQTPEGLVGLMNAYKTALAAGHVDTIRDDVANVDTQYKRLSSLSSTTPEHKLEMDIAYAELVQQLALLGEVESLRKIGAVDALIGLLYQNYNQPSALLPILKALKELADLDADFNATIARNTPSLLMGPCAPTLKANPLLLQAALALLYSLACNEGNGKLIASTVGFDQLMTAIEMATAELVPEEREEMKKVLSTFKYMVEQDNPQALTLKQVYERWTSRKSAGDTLEITESAVVLQQLDFVSDYTDQYGSQPLTSLDTELGSEFRYGCLCFSLLHEYPLNSGICIEKNEPQVLLRALQTQKVLDIVQCAVVATRDMCAHADCALSLCSTPGAKETIQNLLSQFPPGGNASTPEEASSLIIPRLEIFERTAITRGFYDGDVSVSTLVSIWNDCDNGLYTVETLQHVFRAMRRSVHESWVQSILKNDVPQRLLSVVKDIDIPTRGSLIPDVMFLIGKLATVPDLKQLFTQLDAATVCLDLLKSQLKTPQHFSSAIVVNTCLALANITIGNETTILRFCQNDGVKVTIDIVQRAMQDDKLDYDIGNAAAILMCNLCYRNDNLKQLFGEKQAARAVTQSIQKYDGSDSRYAFRCLESMFNAVGNLALYPPNIDRFLNEHIEKTFAYLFENSDFLPDKLVEVCLRTMSNLVLENTDESMERFGVVLLPILTMLQNTRRESFRMLASAFEVLTNLSRLPKNADNFVKNNGIDITLRVANTHMDAQLAAAAVNLLSVQAANPDCLARMIDAGVFKFLANVFESQAIADDRSVELCVTALRCLRRLLLDREAADTFIKAQGVNGILHLTTQSPEVPTIQLDAYRSLLALLSMYPPPAPEPTKGHRGSVGDADWDADVADEGVLGLIHQMERPPSPRSWESLGLEPAQIRALITTVCTCVSDESCRKLQKLQRFGLGLLAYFACEKVQDTVEAFYAETYQVPVRQAITTFPSDTNILKTCCYIIANVSYVSDAEDYRVIAHDKALRQALEDTASKLSRKANVVRDFAITIAKLLADRKDPSPNKFESIVDWNYPLELTEWYLDVYPNGVQDLHPDIKRQLREGSRAKLVIEAKLRTPFWWKSSQDLGSFQWKTTDDPNASYSRSVPISRLRNLGRGVLNPALKAAASKDRKLDARLLLTITGPPTEDMPEGLLLNLKLKTRKERDQLWSLLCDWRDAATYGT